MKALQFQGPNKMALIDAPMPVPAADQLLIKTGAAIICTSDLNDLRGNPFGIKLPIIFGHEGAGAVVGMGEKVRGFSPGDVVATHPVHPCYACDNCRAGMAHLCANMGHFGVNMQGTFAEYYLVRADRARQAPAGADVATAALAEPVCVCLEAIAQARVDAGSSVLVMGDGPFGVMIATLLRGMSVGRVVLAGEHDFRLRFAAGCETLNLCRETDRLEALKRWAGSGFDAVILAVGSAEAARQALAVLKAKGRLIIFSALHDPVPLDLFAVHLKELEIIGACNDQDWFDDAMKLLFQPELNLSRLITHRFALDQFEEAFAIAATGHDRALKVAFLF
jgi:2-desacetyl-2-hydroxyethyl bacteriochlorophyllide A dehydrogenase